MQDEITLLMFRLDFQYVRIAILKPAYEYQTALGRSKEYPSATLRPRCYHICLPRELSLSLSLPVVYWHCRAPSFLRAAELRWRRLSGNCIV